MTSLPSLPTPKKLGLVIDLDVCVGCHACVISCKEWNTGGYAAVRCRIRIVRTQRCPDIPQPRPQFRGDAGGRAGDRRGGRRAHRAFPEILPALRITPCVTVCPTRAIYKRAADGIVLVDEDKCIGCGLCAWACPYGAREMDLAAGVMKKCTLCVDRVYNETIDEIDRVPSCVRTCPANARHFGDLADPASDVSIMVAERGGMDLMPEQGTRPVNKYLPPRPRQALADCASKAPVESSGASGFFAWLDGVLERM